MRSLHKVSYHMAWTFGESLATAKQAQPFRVALLVARRSSARCSPLAADVKPDNRLPVTNVQAGIPAAGQLAGSFQIEVPAPSADAGRARNLAFVALLRSVHVCFAQALLNGCV